MEDRAPGAIIPVFGRRVFAARVLAAIVIGFAFAGCHPATRQDKISATDGTTFDSWVEAHRQVLSPAELKELDEARQQLRFVEMQQHPGTPSDELNRAVYAEINGHTLNEVLIRSYNLQIERMKTEMLNYQPQLERFHAHQQERSLSDEQKETVNAAIEKLNRLMSEHQTELTRLTKRLSELEHESTPTPPAGS